MYASYASLTDLRAAARGATIGFAGPRVVEQATGTALSAGVHTAEFAYDHGLVDALVAPNDEASWVEGALGLREVAPPFSTGSAVRTDIAVASAWGEVVGARAPDRPTGVHWAARLCSSWTDLHGPDPVVRAGLATFEGTRLVVVATDRFAGDGRPRPAGYRLAQRCAVQLVTGRAEARAVGEAPAPAVHLAGQDAVLDLAEPRQVNLPALLALDEAQSCLHLAQLHDQRVDTGL